MSLQLNRRRLAIAASTVLGGFLASWAGTHLLPPFDPNYAANGMFDEFVWEARRGLAWYPCGAYLAAALWWLVGRQEENVRPLPVMLVGALGVLVSGLPASLVSLKHLPEHLALPVILTVTTAGGIAAAYAASGLTGPMPRTRTGRLVKALVPLVLFGGLAAWSSRQTHDFPGMTHAAAERRQWAVATFGTLYEQSEAFLRQHPGVTGALGPVRGIAPIAGPNRSFARPGETAFDFTLAISGERGEGIARVTGLHPHRVRKGQPAYPMSGTLTLDGRTVALPPR